MIHNTVGNDINSLRKLFQSEKNENGPFIYIPIDGKNGLSTADGIAKLVGGYKKSGFAGVIPYVSSNYSIEALSDEYYEFYGDVKRESEKNKLSLGYLDDTYIMRAFLEKTEKRADFSCKILVKYEYSCIEGSEEKRELHKTGKLMSVTAVNDDDNTIIDLGKFVRDGVLLWNVPSGNWNIEEYVCEPDLDSYYIDMMSYDISSDYLKQTAGKLFAMLGDEDGEGAVELFIYRNVMFSGKNRRMWSDDFNTCFKIKYGFDPAPYYPLLFRDFSGSEKRYKAMLMECRASILTDGYLKAVADFCRSKNIFSTGFPAEGKASAGSWMFGDGQMLHKYASAPGISLPFAYLYGLNGIKVAAGAAQCFGNDTVTADMFMYFAELSRDIIYRESMNAFVRGINMVFAHLGEDRTKNDDDMKTLPEGVWGSIFSKGNDLLDYASFVARTQTMLRGGEQMAEVAVLYPIHALHSYVYLYQSSQSGFEYPSTPENLDYMELMNNLLSYVGVDSVFLHPDIISENSFSDNGMLYVKNDRSTAKYKLVVMPSMSVISIKVLRVLKKFFDMGGKIIATDSLPYKTVESSEIFDDVNDALRSVSEEDREAKEIIEYIFGSDVFDIKIFKRYYKNTNDKGGCAYFFPSNMTSAEGTDFVSASILYQATVNFSHSPDVYIDGMPRREFFGLLNCHLPIYMRVGIDKRLSDFCSMNYIHKRYSGCDIYYITNTTGEKYSGNILLRGCHAPEEWNPYNGKIKKMQYSFVRFRGEVYTKLNVTIDSSSCVFIVSPMSQSKELVKQYAYETETLEEYYAKEDF